VEAAAPAVGLQFRIFKASTAREINAALGTFAHERADALFVGIDPFFNSRRTQLVHLATRYGIPASYPARDFVHAGGLMSYGANIAEAWRQVGFYAGRILKGMTPADLPVVQSSKFELVINRQTAEMLDLMIPDKLLATADEVIE
jgi:putative ABC transport system substrate-binding protein